jgi:hypothetical protein
MFENTPSHVQQQYAGKTLNWCSSDSEERFNTNLERIETLRLLGSNGWIDSDHPRTKLTYEFNSQGFRSREINLDLTLEEAEYLFTAGDKIKAMAASGELEKIQT